MKDKYIYLNYYQACMFIIKINELKNTNSNFKSTIADNFISYVKTRSVDIYLTPKILFKINKNANKYKITKAIYNYLVKITKMDVFDEETYYSYIGDIFDLEDELLSDKYEFKNQITKLLKNYTN